ncbi:major pollen allergen Lol p 11-like [Amaranthus tricolor]|uniref:major pollen allergen Lol p 11-like n=1 Tax=Amaranthus tricolor TaxID=29722 RepID=UPI0025841B3B|nr:major pollen allergen Lol p 11-like [Amaranthus tricolor]
MAKIVGALVLLCVLPAISMAARPEKKPYCVRGRVYCDHCKAGFETPASTYLEGAKVKLECRHRHTQNVLYSAEAVTDATGSYKIFVHNDQKDNVCDTILVSSPHKTCSIPDQGRDRSRVVLTSYNGVVSYDRYANNMGFMVNEPLSFCSQLMQQYQLTEDEV